ncbi:LysR family transcriptional regulator [Vibrio sp. SS-MA-C1-2]|uniref:LysR family transcriptional regulator n=1 Tax=Vibrio sp. SS-MA-C1-2 TaxID=2908646 RepID=UPI001F17C21C|nr:LysR family transcriptional regulator [Vibrio sp. SS-MA-C1-2]UJF17570.1 LysR family transcriptional regulator [Vibrio sp. SS-MA-C1-2]
MRLDDFNLFRIVVEQGNYSLASKQSGVTITTLTRRLSTLEKTLNTQLLTRDSRRVTLTDAGQRFYSQCTPTIMHLLKNVEFLNKEHKTAAGKLRIAAPSGLSKIFLQPMFNAFMSQYPEISIELLVSNDTNQLDPTDWDVLFRIGSLRDSTLIAKKIHQVEDILVASPKYLVNAQPLLHPQDLNEHTLLRGSPLLRWRLANKHNDCVVIDKAGRFEANNLNIVKQACIDGLGVTLMPDTMVKEQLQRGELVRVLKDWSANEHDLFLLYNHRKHQSEKLRVFIEFANQYFQPKH